jgi:hypothetical protein
LPQLAEHGRFFGEHRSLADECGGSPDEPHCLLAERKRKMRWKGRFWGGTRYRAAGTG